MRMKRYMLLVSISMALMLTLTAPLAVTAAEPVIPTSFYGNVTVNGSAAPSGTVVTGQIVGAIGAPGSGSITVTTAGQYGAYGLAAKLAVKTDNSADMHKTIEFYIQVSGGASAKTGQNATFDSDVHQLNLSVTGYTMPVAGVGGGGAAPTPITGVGTVSFPSDGTASTVTIYSQDYVSSGTIPAGTTVKDALGNPLGTITCVPPTTPAPVPPAQNALVMYDFGPTGATFSQNITITMKYDPAKLPANVTASSLVIAYYDTASGQWINLSNIVVDPVNHTVSGQTNHFTQFAVLANLIIQPVVTPTPTPTKSPSPTVAATPPPAATPSPSLSPAPQPTGAAGQPAAGGINWILWIIIAVVVIAILVLVYLWFVRWRS